MNITHPLDTPEYNKAFVIAHFEEFVNKKNAAIALVNFSEDFLDHDENGGPAVGPQKAKQMMEMVHHMFPDIHVQIEEIIAEGDKVMVRNIWSHKNFMGSLVQFKGFVLWRLKGGKIVERWATIGPTTSVHGNKVQW
jgi:predicted ester cyclase